MKTKTQHRIQKKIPTHADDESRAAAAEIAAVAREAAEAGRAGQDELNAALDDPDTIPMLTDVLGDDNDGKRPAGAATSASPTDVSAAAPVTTKALAGGTSEPSDKTGSRPATDWNALALKVEHNVMARMTRRTDAFIDGELRDQLDDILDAGCERLLADIRHTMQQSIRTAVASAIAEEMSKIRHGATKGASKQEKNV